MMKNNNIILIGMPAVGKSTIGVILAKVMGYAFLDSDILIQKEQGRLLSEMIAQEGIEGFLAIENAVNYSIETENTVIATGGSAVYGQEAMTHFQAIGTIVYLKEEFSVIEKRLLDIAGRGVVLRQGQTLKSLFEERSILYEQYADLIIEERSRSAEETLQEILLNLLT